MDCAKTRFEKEKLFDNQATDRTEVSLLGL
jgi:hypothetical protein